MGRVLVVSGAYSLEHADKDLGVVGELQRRGHQVRHVVVAADVPPPFPRPVVEGDPRFREVGSVWVAHLAEAARYLPECQVVLIPGHKGVERLSDWAHHLGRVVVQHQNHGGFDSYYYGADLVAAKGPYFADFLRRQWNLSEEKVVSTGSVQYDAAFRPEALGLSRDEFCRLYNLDPAKRIAVWLPTREDRQQVYYDWSKENYRRVCQIVTHSSNHSLIIKPHPGDLPDPNLPPQPGPRWAETLSPGAAVCRAEHGYALFHLCDVGLANWSTTGLEFSLFRRPFLYVDVAENPRIDYLKKLQGLQQPIGFYQDTMVPGFVGQTVTSAELPQILETAGYQVSDESLYDQHTARFLTSADGQAYVRVADLVERGLALAPAGRPTRARVARLQGRIWLDEARRRFSQLRHRPGPARAAGH